MVNQPMVSNIPRPFQDSPSNPVAPNTLQALRQLLNAAIDAGTFPGASVWAGHRGIPQIALSVGHRARHPQPLPMDANTLFDLASLTKPMVTATLWMALMDRLNLSLSTPIYHWLPAFAPRPGRKRQITAYHLLTHSSGLPAWQNFFQYPPPAGMTPQQGIVAQACAVPLERHPGQRSIYSDVGFILLGAVLEQVSQTALSTLFQQQVVTPLGLQHCGFNPDNQPDRFGAHNVAATLDCPRRHSVLCGVVHDDNAHSMGGVAGHAGLFADAATVGAWAQALLDVYHGRSDWLPQTRVKEFWARTRSIPGSSWALGFDTPTTASSSGSHFGPHSVGHLGYTGTSVWIDPDAEWIVVLLSNRLHPDDTTQKAMQQFRPQLHDAVWQAVFGSP